MPSTHRRLELKEKTSMVQNAWQASVYANGLTNLTFHLLACSIYRLTVSAVALQPMDRPINTASFDWDVTAIGAAITWLCVKSCNDAALLFQVFYCPRWTQVALYLFLCKAGHPRLQAFTPAGSARAVLRFVMRLKWNCSVEWAITVLQFMY